MTKPIKTAIILIFLFSCLFAQSWIQVGNDIDSATDGSRSGYSVSMSADGKRIAISSIWGDDGAGSVKIYDENGGIWSQVGSTIEGEAIGDRFGTSISMSSDGKMLAIGAPMNDGQGSNMGHVRVYSELGGIWTQFGIDLWGKSGLINLNSGTSVSMSADGNKVAIGAPGVYKGQVDLFSQLPSYPFWTNFLTIEGEAIGDQFGTSVSMSADGNKVAIGAIGNDGTGSEAGHVRIYSVSGAQIGADIDGEAIGDQFGTSVSMSADGKRVGIGAIGNDWPGAIGGSGIGEDAGHIRVYSESGGVWTQIGNDIDGEATNDSSGVAISMSDDGKVVAIGANHNDGIGISAGHVRIYTESGGVWTQLGNDIDGEATGDESGFSISLSSNGSRIVIGAPYNDGTGLSAGHARIYYYSMCANGSIVYNLSTGKFNFCEDGVWVEK